MRDIRNLRLEFRVPISPTPGFFSQVRVFEFALRRLASPYNTARIMVTVGDDCDLDAVQRANPWSGGRIDWVRVPDIVFAEFGIHGTADWRVARGAGDADIVILSDADTVLLRDIDPLLEAMPLDAPALRGHMAHAPPPSVGLELPPSGDSDYWPTLFARFGITWPRRLFTYSMDETKRLPNAPAYFNLGFVAVNRAALVLLGPRILPFQRAFRNVVDNHMRCQIAISLIAHQAGIDIDVLPAAFNAANDIIHLRHNYLAPEDIRVLHYLRTDEVARDRIFLDEHIAAFLDAELSNPANRALRALAREYWGARSKGAI